MTIIKFYSLSLSLSLRLSYSNTRKDFCSSLVLYSPQMTQSQMTEQEIFTFVHRVLGEHPNC